VRPGPISEHLVQTCSELGYPLCVTELRTPCLIECYPHPALVELSGAEERLCYKVARIGSYWKSSPPLERRERLLAVWETIVAMLELRMGGVRSALPAVTAISTTSSLKAYEDALDAVVCACVGICALEGRVTRHGDDTSAIWVPFGASEVAA
jgi:predicted RNase H-like nuclease